MPFIWHQMAWKNLADFEHPTWKGKSIKTSHNHWAKYTYIWFHIKTTIEYYTQVPLSTMLKCHWVLCSSAFEYYTQVPLSTILKCHWVLCSRPLSIIFKCHWVLYSSSVTSLTVFSWFCLTLFGDINCNNWQVLTKCPKRLDSFVEATLKSLTILAAGHAEPRLVVW